MSETTKKKRVNKTENELVDQLIEKKINDFKDELRALEDKYSLQLEPILHFSNRGVVPTITVVDIKKPVEASK